MLTVPAARLRANVAKVDSPTRARVRPREVLLVEVQIRVVQDRHRDRL